MNLRAGQLLVVAALLAPRALAQQSTESAPSPGAPAPSSAAAAGELAPSEDPAAAAVLAAPAPVPAVVEVEFENRAYFKDETLRSFVLHPVPGPLDEEALRADAARIAARFQDRGFLAARARVRTVAVPGGVKAIFVLEPGSRAELKRVKVVGNESVDEAALKEGFFSRPPEPLGVLTRAGFFHKPYLDQDGQRLVANYYRRGFLEARVVDTRVEADATLDGLAVTLRVTEGHVYELGDLQFTGELPDGVSVEEMRARISVKSGDVADLVTIQQQADALLEPLRLAGHPFARLEQAVQMVPPPSGDPARRGVSLTLRFVRGPRPVVRTVRISGNRGTQERVIRRDVQVKQDAPYDHSAMKATERALMATGFFSAVQTRALPTEDPNLVDVEVAVTEQQTWLASVAPAFDTTAGGEGLIGIAVLADRNFLGTGLFVSTFARLSSRRQTFDLTVSEPRLFDSRTSLTGDLHRREISYLAFRTRSELGGGLRVNVPVGGGFFVGGGAGVEYGGVVLYDEEKNDPFTGPALTLNDAAGLFPSGVFRNPVSLSISWDRRDSILLPRNGAFVSVQGSYAGPLTLSGVGFLDSGANLKLFWTPLWGITLKSNTDVGTVFNPHGGDVPVTDRYFLGGLGSVRGYPVLSLSPVDSVATSAPVDEGLAELCGEENVGRSTCSLAIGGTTRFVQNIELEFPLWPNTPFRGFGFLDAGNTFSAAELARGHTTGRGADQPLNLFYSTGFGFLIETPVLPFRFEWSVPLTRRSFDQPISFFLGVGSAF